MSARRSHAPGVHAGACGLPGARGRASGIDGSAIEHSMADLGVPCFDFGVGLSAPSRGVVVWALIREIGVAGMAARIRRHDDMAAFIARAARQHPNLELLQEPTLSICCFPRRQPRGERPRHTQPAPATAPDAREPEHAQHHASEGPAGPAALRPRGPASWAREARCRNPTPWWPTSCASAPNWRLNSRRNPICTVEPGGSNASRAERPRMSRLPSSTPAWHSRTQI